MDQLTDSSPGPLARVCPPRGLQPAGAVITAMRPLVPPDTGRVIEAVEQDVGAYISQVQTAARAAALRAALPANRATCWEGLACLSEDQHSEALAAWLADPDMRTLILVGPTGSGKTHAAYATAAEAARRGAAMVGRRTGVRTFRPLIVRAWTAENYLAALRPEGSPDPVWRVRDRARTAELLLLDDLGAEMDEAGTRHARTELAGLLDWRLEACLRTTFTTNLPAARLEEVLGRRFMSRLSEHSCVIKFLGTDRRVADRPAW